MFRRGSQAWYERRIREHHKLLTQYGVIDEYLHDTENAESGYLAFPALKDRASLARVVVISVPERVTLGAIDDPE